jgi:hypothetical protein
MFVPKIDGRVPERQTALAEIDRVVSERLGRARVAGNAQPPRAAGKRAFHASKPISKRKRPSSQTRLPQGLGGPMVGRRAKKVAAAFNRQVAMYLAKRVGGWSLTRIGKFYNGRHHTTVRHAIRRIEALRAVSPDVDGLLTVLIEQIKAVGVRTPGRRERVVRRIAITESALPITEEFLIILADRLASHLTLRIDEILATRQLDAGSGRM